jgi:hypothetical protein
MQVELAQHFIGHRANASHDRRPGRMQEQGCDRLVVHAQKAAIAGAGAIAAAAAEAEEMYAVVMIACALRETRRRIGAVVGIGRDSGGDRIAERIQQGVTVASRHRDHVGHTLGHRGKAQRRRTHRAGDRIWHRIRIWIGAGTIARQIVAAGGEQGAGATAEQSQRTQPESAAQHRTTRRLAQALGNKIIDVRVVRNVGDAVVGVMRHRSSLLVVRRARSLTDVTAALWTRDITAAAQGGCVTLGPAGSPFLPASPLCHRGQRPEYDLGV